MRLKGGCTGTLPQFSLADITESLSKLLGNTEGESPGALEGIIGRRKGRRKDFEDKIMDEV